MLSAEGPAAGAAASRFSRSRWVASARISGESSSAWFNSEKMRRLPRERSSSRTRATTTSAQVAIEVMSGSMGLSTKSRPAALPAAKGRA